MTRLANPAAVARFADDNVAHFPNGGGGDFSLASVTLTSYRDLTIYGATTFEEGEDIYSQGVIGYASISTPVEIPVILYKGAAFLELSTELSETDTVTLSGDITEPEQNFFLITGDGSITITGGAE